MQKWKSIDTWSNRQVGLGVQNEAGQMLTEFCQENALVIAKTLFQQHKNTTHGHNQMVNTKIRLNICRQRWRSSLYTASKKKTWS